MLDILRNLCYMFSSSTKDISEVDEMPANKDQLDRDWTLADLFQNRGVTVQEVSDRLHINRIVVMEWICGLVPDAKSCAGLSTVLDCSLSELYKALVNTPCVL